MTDRIAQERPIRVVRIIDRLNIGGPAKHVVWLTAALNQGDFQTTLVTGRVSPDEGDMRYFADAAGVTPVMIPEFGRAVTFHDFVVIFKLVRLFMKLRPHIIHTHKAKAGATGRIAAWIYRWMTPSCVWLHPRTCHVVHTFHGHIFHAYFSPPSTRLAIMLERMLAYFATNKIIALSRQQYEELVSQYRIGVPSQFRIVPLGLDVKEEVSEGGLRAELGIHSEMPLIGFVGRLCEIKNLTIFLDAAHRLLSRGVVVKFVLIGDGPSGSKLKTRVERLGLSGSVFFTGFRKDTASLYRDLDVVVLSSLNEGTPLTLIEAMAAGRAIASTEVGGVSDLMGQRHSGSEWFTIWDHGVTARSGDSEGLAQGLLYLINGSEERQAMGERGRAYVQENHLFSRLVRDIVNLYLELVS
jgi:glycosyltransferase involved in cell wall biosynthesis